MEPQECGMSQPGREPSTCSFVLPPSSLGEVLVIHCRMMSVFPPKKRRLVQMHAQLFVDEQPGMVQRRAVCPSLAGGIQCQKGRIVMAQLHPSAFPSEMPFISCTFQRANLTVPAPIPNGLLWEVFLGALPKHFSGFPPRGDSGKSQNPSDLCWCCLSWAVFPASFSQKHLEYTSQCDAFLPAFAISG